LDDRRAGLERFCWWPENVEEIPTTLESLTPSRIRAYLSYQREARPGGRFGTEKRPSSVREAKAATVHAAYRMLRAFSNFLLAEGRLDKPPLHNVKPPRVPKGNILPFTDEQVLALNAATRQSRAPDRDAAIFVLLYDTGLRASELIDLTVGDVDRSTGELTVVGKGSKRRTVFMSTAARRALWRYLEAERRDAMPSDPLFISVGGNTPGAHLTLAGVHDVVAHAGSRAKITDRRCSPHTCRHTFAVSFLRNGGSVLELQRLLGHESLEMVRRYVELVDEDLKIAHRRASPADRLRLR
jgi:site-specific recombinase XerD